MDPLQALAIFQAAVASGHFQQPSWSPPHRSSQVALLSLHGMTAGVATLRLYTSLMELQAAAVSRKAVNMHLAAKLSLATDKVGFEYPCTVCCIRLLPLHGMSAGEHCLPEAVHLPDGAAGSCLEQEGCQHAPGSQAHPGNGQGKCWRPLHHLLHKLCCHFNRQDSGRALRC